MMTVSVPQIASVEPDPTPTAAWLHIERVPELLGCGAFNSKVPVHVVVLLNSLSARAVSSPTRSALIAAADRTPAAAAPIS